MGKQTTRIAGLGLEQLLDAPNLPQPCATLLKSTTRHDRGLKFTEYAANGIAEYWIVNPGKQTIEQYALDLDMEEYTPIKTVTNREEIESQQVVGFRVPVLAVFDEQANIETLNNSLSC